MWSHARFDLKLSEAEFWSSSPRQIQYLDKKYAQRIEREEFYSALIACTSANYSMCRPKEPLKPADFMPSQRHKPEHAAGDDDNAIAQQIQSILKPRSIPKKKD